MHTWELYRMRHARLDAEILTAKENIARHLLTDIHTAAAKADRVLMRPSWGVEAGEDETDLAAAAGDILNAATALIESLNLNASLVSLDRLHGQYLNVDHPTAEVWPFRLSTILSIYTRAMVAREGPDSVERALRWMIGCPDPIPLGSERSKVAAEFCTPRIAEQFPALARKELTLPAIPAVPAWATTDTIDQPKIIADWVRRVAAALNLYEGRHPDPPVPLRQLSRAERAHAAREMNHRS